MFDWNDEELTNIIWGEAGESDDQIVSYPEQVEEKPALYGDNVKKEANQKTSNTSTNEQKKATTKPELELGLDSSTSKYDTTEETEGFGFNSSSDGVERSSSNAAEDQSTLGNATISNKAKSPMRVPTLDEPSQLESDSELLKKQPEDGEQGDFVDYSWANIGSFDDLDRIFSNNDDPIFGDLSVGNTDELWPSSSKDVTGSSLEPATLSGDSSDFPQRGLRTSTEDPEIEAQYVLDQNRPFISGYDTFNVTHAPRDAQASIDNIEPTGGKSNLLIKRKTFKTGGKIQASSNKDVAAPRPYEISGKTNRPKKFNQKSDKKTEIRQPNNPSTAWPSPQYPPSVASLHPPLMLPQQQKHFSGVPLATPLYGNVANPYSTPVMAQFHHPMDRNRELLSPRYASSVKDPADPSVKPMTPEEKIEKLRRRQQMRAKLAIQKQQLQFGNQIAPLPENSNVEGGNNVEVEESLGSYHSLEPNSPLERGPCNKIGVSLDNNCSVEESVLYRLQETIASLDVRIRLSIRDSLFRLAQSAMLRQLPNDTSSAVTGSSREEASHKDKVNHERFTPIPDIETDTNPIDRTVAHLLFHRPMEFSGNKPVDTAAPESPLSANMSYERVSNSSRSLQKGYLPKSPENTQIISPKGPRTPMLASKDEQQPKVSPRAVTSGDASKNENVDPGLTKDGSSI